MIEQRGNKFLLNTTRKMPVSWFYHELMVFAVVIFAATSGKNEAINKRNVIISFSVRCLSSASLYAIIIF
jgi:hypothetical protein